MLLCKGMYHFTCLQVNCYKHFAGVAHRITAHIQKNVHRIAFSLPTVKKTFRMFAQSYTNI